MSSQRRYPPQICYNPDCNEEFIPHDRRQIYCCVQCCTNYHNDKRFEENEERFFREKELRDVDRILGYLMDTAFYQNEEIQEEILNGFLVDRTIGMLEKNLLTNKPIRWYHSYGIELVENKSYTIHQRTKV